MPWRRMRLRRAEVLARCDESGELVAREGRVEVRYKRDDGRAYFAAVSNLQAANTGAIEPDSFCEPAEAVKRQGSERAPKPGNRDKPPETPVANEILAYADGACSGNPGPAGVGVVARFGDQEQELSEYIGEATNNIAELTAILRAVELASTLDRPLRIYTDSQYSIGVLTKGWKAKANQDLVASVRAAIAKHADTELFHVRGHQGIALNERADELAVLAVQNRASTGWVQS